MQISHSKQKIGGKHFLKFYGAPSHKCNTNGSDRNWHSAASQTAQYSQQAGRWDYTACYDENEGSSYCTMSPHAVLSCYEYNQLIRCCMDSLHLAIATHIQFCMYNQIYSGLLIAGSPTQNCCCFCIVCRVFYIFHIQRFLDCILCKYLFCNVPCPTCITQNTQCRH